MSAKTTTRYIVQMRNRHRGWEAYSKHLSLGAARKRIAAEKRKDARMFPMGEGWRYSIIEETVTRREVK